MKKKGSKLWTALTAVLAVLLVVCIIAIPVTNGLSTSINIALKADTQKIIPDPNPTNYFRSDYDDEAD